MLNLNKEILTLRGENTRLSYPSAKAVDALPKLEDGEPDQSKLPNDTFRNVIINCLALYPVKDKREVLWVSSLASEIMGAGDTIELTDQHRGFLIDVLYAQTFQTSEKGEKSGIYMSWITAQILKDLEAEKR